MANTKRTNTGLVVLNMASDGRDAPMRSLVIIDEQHHMRGRGAWGSVLRELGTKAVAATTVLAIESGMADAVVAMAPSSRLPRRGAK